MKRFKLIFVVVIKNCMNSSKRSCVVNGTFLQASKRASDLCSSDEYVYSLTVA